jgi:hypothetical protein
MPTDRQTDRHDEANRQTSQFWEVPVPYKCNVIFVSFVLLDIVLPLLI